jgi:hypothetical protein
VRDILGHIGRTPLVPLRRIGAGLPVVLEEGLLVGGSAGTHVAAALRVAARGDVAGPVVTVLPDAWDRYRAQPWMRAWAE